ncbi:hypothetical protein RND71_013154 [Anisodus tanguticus]|uniref:Uncharacterized protein n=1 Tax=Anisodus tanguticus TaxID=243964 RepID=A0AAE1SH50_9SOLA|nr:hypothetical protein RND71_013154 [Anisodus tanguticus]
MSRKIRNLRDPLQITHTTAEQNTTKSRPLNGDGKKLINGGWEMRVEIGPPLLFKVSYGTSYSWDVFLIGAKVDKEDKIHKP